MMLRLANDAQHDVRPAKTASGASEREGGLCGLDSRPKTREKEGGRNKVHNTMICSEIKVALLNVAWKRKNKLECCMIMLTVLRDLVII